MKDTTKTPKVQEAQIVSQPIQGEAEMTLHEHLVRIQQELKVHKGQRNTFAEFNYRSCEDIIEAVKPLLNGLALLLSDDIIHVGDRYYIKATVSLSNGVDMISTSALAREAEHKTKMDDAQVTGGASSYARKYALSGLFALDDTKDPDSKDNAQEPKENASNTPQNAPKQQSTTDSVLNSCPECRKGTLVERVTKTGKYYLKCSESKWNSQTQQEEGCRYIKWGKAITPQQETIDDVPVPEE